MERGGDSKGARHDLTKEFILRRILVGKIISLK
jgi:hypothetical protein